MTTEQALHILIHALKDSAIVFAVVFAIYVLLSFIEVKIAKVISKDSKLSPLFGSLFGLIPQCGVSVVGSDLYLKHHITMGTIVAIFLSCSDEALPILLGSASSKALSVIPLMIIKFVVGFVVGFVIDLIVRDKKEVHEHLEHCHHEEEVHIGCCHHHIDDEKEDHLHKNLIHPLVHSLKILAYVFIINLIFGYTIGFIGEETLKDFLVSNRYLAPLFATLIGVIPNCASSVVITELYVMNGISFGACLGGLLMNSGLGLVYLLKNKHNLKNTMVIILICFSVSILVSYVTCLCMGF